MFGMPYAGRSGGGVAAMSLLSSGVSRHVHDLQLDAVGIVEEHGVVAQLVGVLLRTALDLGAVLAQPLGALVDGRAGDRVDRKVVQSDLVAVQRCRALRLRLAQADRRRRAPEVVDRLASLALDLADPCVAERERGETIYYLW